MPPSFYHRYFLVGDNSKGRTVYYTSRGIPKRGILPLNPCFTLDDGWAEVRLNPYIFELTQEIQALAKEKKIKNLRIIRETVTTISKESVYKSFR